MLISPNTPIADIIFAYYKLKLGSMKLFNKNLIEPIWQDRVGSHRSNLDFSNFTVKINRTAS